VLEGRAKDAAPSPAKRETLDSPPDYFGPDELAEWDRVLAYARLGVIRPPEYGTVVGLCTLYGTAIAASRDVAVNGLTSTPPNGHTQQRAEVGTMRAAWKEYRQFASELGLTPTSRTRLEIPEPKVETPMARLLGAS
jgi:P27 family predicted phage terminase small subunit